MRRKCPSKLSSIASLETADWPEADRRLFDVPDRTDDPFAKPSPTAGWSQPYRDTVQPANTYWLGFNKQCHPERLSWPPAARFTVDAIARFETILATNGVSTMSRVSYLARLLALARAANPSEDWSWFAEGVKRLRSMATPTRPKPIVDAKDIFGHGVDLMEQAMADEHADDVTRAIAFRNGLMLAFWIARPLRLRNFAALDINKHLQISDETITIVVPGEQVKNRRSMDPAVPDFLCPYLRLYLLVVRPLIPGSARHSGLWAAETGRPLASGSLYHYLRRITYERFGVALHPHSMRHSAGTSIALTTPLHAKITMSLLEHSRLATGSHYYNAATTVAAQRKFVAHLQCLRKQWKMKYQTRRTGRGEC